MTSAGWLLLRRAEGLWAIRPGTLRELGSERPPRLELHDGTSLQVDEVLTLVPKLRAWPFPRVAQRFLPEPVHALALWCSRPVVLLDSGPPPPCLRAGETESRPR